MFLRKFIPSTNLSHSDFFAQLGTIESVRISSKGGEALVSWCKSWSPLLILTHANKHILLLLYSVSDAWCHWSKSFTETASPHRSLMCACHSLLYTLYTHCTTSTKQTWPRSGIYYFRTACYAMRAAHFWCEFTCAARGKAEWERESAKRVCVFYVTLGVHIKSFHAKRVVLFTLSMLTLHFYYHRCRIHTS